MPAGEEQAQGTYCQLEHLVGDTYSTIRDKEQAEAAGDRETVEKLKENEDIKMFYLGLTEMGTKRSYRDSKFYKRRKRWLT